MPTTSPYEGIAEFKEAASVDEANGSLKSGYVLIKVIEKTNTDSSTTIVYVLGKPKAGPLTQQQQRPQRHVKGRRPPHHRQQHARRQQNRGPSNL